MRKPCAWIGLKSTPNYRRDSFASGFQKHGYQIDFNLPRTALPGDVLLVWNRAGAGDNAARLFERIGNTVLVAENGYLGKQLNGEVWYALSRSHHNGLGTWSTGDSSRWQQMQVDLKSFRTDGTEIVLLPQRGIGERGVAMPPWWINKAAAQMNGRIRYHPGLHSCIDLEQDLRNARAVYTWGSGAAIKALVYGVPVVYDLEGWIGAEAASRIGEPLNCNEGKRQSMFERLAWAQWRLSEIEDGSAFERLL